MSKHRVITKPSPEQKLIPVPLLCTHAGSTGKAAQMLSISLCKQMINTLHLIIKAWISCYSRGRAFAAKMPSFPMVIFQRERRSASHLCVFMADLNYGIRFAPNRTNCQLSWPTLPYRPLLSLGSSVTQSIPEFLALRLDSFLPYGERESRQV